MDDSQRGCLLQGYKLGMERVQRSADMQELAREMTKKMIELVHKEIEAAERDGSEESDNNLIVDTKTYIDGYTETRVYRNT